MAQLLLANFIHAIYSYFIVSSFSDTAVPLSQINSTLILPKMASNNERSFIMIKPDGVQRGLVGEIISRFEKKGFKLVAMKVMQASVEHLEKHYADLSSKGFFRGLVTYMASGPVCAMVRGSLVSFLLPYDDFLTAAGLGRPERGENRPRDAR